MDEVKKRYFKLITAALISGLVYFNSESLRIRFQLWRVENIIRADDMGWPQDVDEIIKDLKNTTNKRHLSEIMLSQSNGSIVAEGMVVVVEEKFSDGEEILSRYTNDKRWNYWLTFNNNFSQLSLLAWKIKMNKSLTVSEEKFLTGWDSTLDGTFKIKDFLN
jgi:hypothetical protein